MLKFRKNLFVILIVILFSFVIQDAYAQGVKYRSYSGHYSFFVPNNWKEMSMEEINELQTAYTDQLGESEFWLYKTGYYEIDMEGDEILYPYMLVAETKTGVNLPSYEKLKEAFISQDYFDEGLRNADEASDALSDSEKSGIVTDDKKKAVFTAFSGTIENVGKIRGTTVMFLGKEKMVSLNFYSKANHYDSDWETFNNIINSFSWDDGYEYSDIALHLNGSDNSGGSKRFIANVIGYSIIGGMFAGVSFVWNKFIRRNRNKK